MKYLDEFGDAELARRLLDDIAATVTRPWALMEVCGGQTHSIIRHGIDQLLPEGIELIHGPGCPVCVTPLEMIDRALAIARRPDVIFCSFGDMLLVPGTDRDLFMVRSEGGDVRVAGGELRRTDFQGFLVNANVDLAPDPAFGTTVLAGVPLPFALDLDPGAIDQQVQGAVRTSGGDTDLQRLLPP